MSDSGQHRDEGAPDDEVLVDRAEHAAVLASSPGCRPSRTRGPRGHFRSAGSRSVGVPSAQVGLVEALAVDVDLAVVALDRLARRGRSTRLMRSLISRPAGSPRRPLEHDEVAPVHVVELVAQLVDEDPVVDLERGHHRLGRDVERLDEEGLDRAARRARRRRRRATHSMTVRPMPWPAVLVELVLRHRPRRSGPGAPRSWTRRGPGAPSGRRSPDPSGAPRNVDDAGRRRGRPAGVGMSRTAQWTLPPG